MFTKENTSNLHLLKPALVHPTIIDTIEISSSDVYEELHHLDVSKACGPDLLTPFLLKLTAEYISVPLSQLFNKSIISATLPSDWISANIVPIHKRKDKHLPENYCPISLTSIVVKVLERIIHRQLVSALESHQLLNSSQYGFRAKHSTVTLLSEAIDDWSSSLECRGTVHCLLLDFAKAFDSVPHERLLLKLNLLGIDGNLLSWMRYFLTRRRQRVVINGVYSNWETYLRCASGLSIGSTLVPIVCE